jgi:HAD superfamily 5'-nucleotidase-like hydrolase
VILENSYYLAIFSNYFMLSLRRALSTQASNPAAVGAVLEGLGHILPNPAPDKGVFVPGAEPPEVGGEEEEEEMSPEDRALEAIRVKFEKIRPDLAPEKVLMPSAVPDDEKIPEDNVFCSAPVDFRRKRVIGFDLDYSLLSYKDEVLSLIYKTALQTLIQERGYPIYSGMEFSRSFAVRGLHFDKVTACLMKLDINNTVQLDTVHLGRSVLDPGKFMEMRNNTARMSPHDMKHNLEHLVDLFSLPMACLLADAVQALLDRGTCVNGAIVYDHVREAIGKVHARRVWHDAVIKEPERYLHNDGDEIRNLLVFLKSKFKTFLLTNSDYYYVDAALKHLLKCSTSDWRALFNVVITSGDKPRFFTADAPPFSRLDLATRYCTPTWPKSKPMLEDPRLVWVGGGAEALMSSLNWKPDEIVYIGDHLYSDLWEASKIFGWTTGAIIRELDKEIRLQNNAFYRLKLQAHLDIQALIDDARALPPSDAVLILIRDMYREDVALKRLLKELCNPYFGSALRCTHQPSFFMSRLSRTAEIYMSRPAYLTKVCQGQLHPTRVFLPHEYVLMRGGASREKEDKKEEGKGGGDAGASSSPKKEAAVQAE